MKLPIKKKWFDMIKNGEKELEWRDAHITFVCEETGETLRKNVKEVSIFPRRSYIEWEEGIFESKEEFEKTLTDDRVICFYLGD
jgi:hypothetical protein